MANNLERPSALIAKVMSLSRVISVKLAAPIASTVTLKIHARCAFRSMIFKAMGPVTNKKIQKVIRLNARATSLLRKEFVRNAHQIVFGALILIRASNAISSQLHCITRANVTVKTDSFQTSPLEENVKFATAIV